MKIEKLKTNIKKVNRIYHLADIHIRLYKRMKEYLEVFDNLYSEIESNYQEGDIIVIAGDLCHSKAEMSPESVQLLSDFLKSVANITTTIVTAGNHDANLNNANRLDAILPIVNTLNHKNLFYLRDTGLYQVGDVVFSVMSVFDDIENYILGNEIDTDLTKIAIFHGPIYNSVTDTKWKVTGKKVQTNLFDGYDIVLLGDIHKMQILQPYSEEEKEINSDELEEYIKNGWLVKE